MPPFVQGEAVQWYASADDPLGVGAYQCALLTLLPPTNRAEEAPAQTVRVISGYHRAHRAPDGGFEKFICDRLRVDVQSIRGNGTPPTLTLEVWSGIVCNGGSVLNYRGTWVPSSWDAGGMACEVFGFLTTDWEIRLLQDTGTMTAIVLALTTDRAGGATAGFVSGPLFTAKGGVHFP